MKIIYKCFLPFFLLVYSSVNAQINKETQLPMDPSTIDGGIIYGVLDNGFTYYIKPVDSLPDIKMNLMVKVGSYYESDEEVNFAHAVEHLSFRATKNFRKQKGLAGNTKLLSALGMSTEDLGGMTGADQTNYFLKAPVTEKALKTGILWFSDIMSGLDISKQSVDRERGVLLQEYLLKQNESGSNRIKNQLKSMLFPWISDRKNFVWHNKNFPYEDLQMFYEKWYRSDRAALSIIGKIQNPAQLKSLIKKQFETPRSTTPPNSKNDVVTRSLKKRPGFGIVKSQVQHTNNSGKHSVEIHLNYANKITPEDSRMMSGIEQKIQADLLSKVLNKRFKELQNSFHKSSEFYSMYRPFVELLEEREINNNFKVVIRTDTLKKKKALQDGIGHLKQLKKYGIKKSEFQESKKELLSEYPLISDSNYGYWQQQIRDHFIRGESLPEHKNSKIRSFIKNLSLEEINKFAYDFVSGMPEDIGIILPQYYKTELISEKFTRNYISKSFSKPVTAYELPETIDYLISPEEKQNLKIGNPMSINDGVLESKEYVLSNGIKLILKPDKYSQSDKMTIRGFSKNGASCFPEKDHNSAILAPSLVKNSGAGQFDKFELNRFYQTTTSLKKGVDLYVNYNEAGLKASVNNDELEILMQLIYLFLSKPHQNQLAYEHWKREQLLFSETAINPINDLNNKLNELIEDKSAPPIGAKRIEAIKEVELNKALDIYNGLFTRPGELTFIITGNFEKEKLLPIIQRYLGNLPTHFKSDSEIVCEPGKPISLAEGPISKSINLENSQNADNAYYALAYIKGKESIGDWKEELKVKVLGKVANALLYRLRNEEELALYYFSAGGYYNRAMGRYELKFRLNCTQEELSLVEKKTKDIIDDIQRGNFSESYLQKAIEELISQYQQFEDLSLWNNESLYRHYKYNEPIIKVDEIQNFLSSLTVEDIEETAQKYFKNEFKYELKSKSKQQF
ncbi:M16 family metallopeptidase [Gillisia sp. Hel_I_29]|uniref:M16 family metallopeptidase n=1 Tax=Gillisia sp. Hel_I_29 TaxID=1249975 RepID=UPI00054DE1AA|nr:insulinase family protein [Gillisia sp. Hel_I_29]